MMESGLIGAWEEAFGLVNWYVRVIGMVHTIDNSGLVDKWGEDGKCI